jgi:hypothetical protein
MESVIVDPEFPSMDPSSAVLPTIRVVGKHLYLAFHLPNCDDSAIVSFEQIETWRYGHPNDEGLQQHRFWGHGLTPYNFHRSTESLATSGTTLWIATFHDGTFEVVARRARIAVPVERDATPSEALTTLLGVGDNRVLDDDAG